MLVLLTSELTVPTSLGELCRIPCASIKSSAYSKRRGSSTGNNASHLTSELTVPTSLGELCRYVMSSKSGGCVGERSSRLQTLSAIGDPSCRTLNRVRK